MVQDAEQLLEFVKVVFGARERLRSTGSAGGLHAEVEIGDSMIMIGGGPNITQTRTAALHIYVADVDAVYGRALQTGATSLEEPQDRPYGDRVATIADGSGTIWYLAERVASGTANS
jgi:uncharacterized glyoxalase superfamily protein PhnB